MKVGVVNSRVMADASCMSPPWFLGGGCRHYEGCKYRKEAGCKATSLKQAKVKRKIVQLQRHLAQLREEGDG